MVGIKVPGQREQLSVDRAREAPAPTTPSPPVEAEAPLQAPLPMPFARGKPAGLPSSSTFPATLMIHSRLTQMVGVKKFVKRDGAAGRADDALKIVLLLEQGVTSSLAGAIRAARTAVDRYARGGDDDPRAAVAALEEAVSTTAPIHEQEIVQHLKEALVAAAEERSVDDDRALHREILATR